MLFLYSECGFLDQQRPNEASLVRRGSFGVSVEVDLRCVRNDLPLFAPIPFC